MEDTAATQVIQRPDGSQSLLLRRAKLSVLKGPDRGAELVIEQPRVRIGSGAECELHLTDAAVSRQHLELLATEQGYLLRDLASTNGTLVAGLRLRQALLVESTTLQIGATVLRLAPMRDTVEIPLSGRGSFGGMLGQSSAMRQLFATLERVAPSEATVLLEGESGTGKEVTAEAIHRASARSAAPFVVVDCGAIPSSLIESELFGHERGAFTGAEQPRVGALEQADGGTLFLDEIGELPLELQPRLLRFLETQQVKRVGASVPRQVDVRVIAATNRHLAHEVKQTRFRADLFFRLSVVRLELPPLRDRPDDVLLLAHHFAEHLARDPRMLLTDEIVALLVAYSWPGNARELRNVVERLALVPEHALSSLREGIDVQSAGGARDAEQGSGTAIGALAELPFHQARGRWQDLFERQYLTMQLERADGVVAQAARRADLPRQSFHRLLRRHGLKGS